MNRMEPIEIFKNKVEAYNTVMDAVLEVRQVLFDTLKNFQGKKIRKKGGDFTKPVSQALQPKLDEIKEKYNLDYLYMKLDYYSTWEISVIMDKAYKTSEFSVDRIHFVPHFKVVLDRDWNFQGFEDFPPVKKFSKIRFDDMMKKRKEYIEEERRHKEAVRSILIDVPFELENDVKSIYW